MHKDFTRKLDLLMQGESRRALLSLPTRSQATTVAFLFTPVFSTTELTKTTINSEAEVGNARGCRALIATGVRWLGFMNEKTLELIAFRPPPGSATIMTPWGAGVDRDSSIYHAALRATSPVTGYEQHVSFNLDFPLGTGGPQEVYRQLCRAGETLLRLAGCNELPAPPVHQVHLTCPMMMGAAMVTHFKPQT